MRRLTLCNFHFFIVLLKDVCLEVRVGEEGIIVNN